MDGETVTIRDGDGDLREVLKGKEEADHIYWLLMR